MPTVLIVYDSRSGNTAKMAAAVGEGARESGVEVNIKSVEQATPDDLAAADGIILGSPNHFGSMSEKMKAFINDSIKVRKKLEDKVGAAFTSGGAVGGGVETTLFSLIQAMMIHSMIIVGDPMEATGHYGAVGIGSPDGRSSETCHKLGKRVGDFVKRLNE
ncbi:MAG: NAD(P)H-dependent oxidoreductase [Dehalococcoidia bacterium]